MENRSIKIIDLKKTILADNDADAEKLRGENRKANIYYINVMSSPGSGKTTTLLRTLENLRPDYRLGVMEADIDSDVDAQTIMDAGTPSVQLHTGGMCHLDAEMSRPGLRAIDAENKDIIFLENVGNLVCPAEFDTGANLNVVLLSITEGDDKPLKYPLMFEKADVVLANKMDACSAFNFDLEKFKENVKLRNPNVQVFPISAKTGEGVDAWCAWLRETVDSYKAQS